jgi:hypothetical protein
MSDRREFLKFLAGSPLLLAYPSLLEAFTQAPTVQAAAATLASAADALDVYDFEAMAHRAAARYGRLRHAGAEGHHREVAHRQPSQDVTGRFRSHAPRSAVD